MGSLLLIEVVYFWENVAIIQISENETLKGDYYVF